MNHPRRVEGAGNQYHNEANPKGENEASHELTPVSSGAGPP